MKPVVNVEGDEGNQLAALEGCELTPYQGTQCVELVHSRHTPIR